MTNQESHLCQVMPKILMLQLLCRYFSGTFHVTGTFQVLFMYLPHLNKLIKSHRYDKPREPFVLNNAKDFDVTGTFEVLLGYFSGTFQVPTSFE